MIHIEKGREPRSLTEYRESTPNASYDGLPTETKNEVRASLLREQGYICAYCMARIRIDTVTIEHYIAQRQNGEGSGIELDYHNMLGVCRGNAGMPHNQETCGKHRGNAPLSVDPRAKEKVDTIRYSSNGRIESASAEFNQDLNVTLNLNISSLVSNRKAALDSMKHKLHAEKKKGEWKKIALKYVRKLSEKEEKDAYVGILLWYLEKKTR